MRMGARFLLVREESYKFGKGENFKHCRLTLVSIHGFLHTYINTAPKSWFLNTYSTKTKTKQNKIIPWRNG